MQLRIAAMHRSRQLTFVVDDTADTDFGNILGVRLLVRRILPALCIAMTVISVPAGLAAQQKSADIAQARQLLLQASRFLNEIPVSDQPSAVANIASQLARAGDLPDALHVVSFLKDPNQSALANSCVAWSVANSGDYSRALSIIASEGDSQTIASQYMQIAAIAAGKANLSLAIEITHRIPDYKIERAEALLRVASETAKSGDPASARAVVGQALRVVEGILPDDPLNRNELEQIARTQVEIGDPSDAAATVSRYSELVSNEKDPRAQVALYQLASLQVQTGDLVGAHLTIEKALPAESSVVRMSVADAEAEQGLTSAAVNDALEIADPVYRDSALRSISISTGTHGSLNEALNVIDEISDRQHRLEAVSALALEQADKGNGAAAQTLQVALAWSSGAQNQTVAQSLAFIAVTRALLKDFSGAEQTLMEIENPDERVWPVENITDRLAAAGQKQEAIDLANAQGTAKAKAYGLLGTARGILEKEDEDAKSQASKQ